MSADGKKTDPLERIADALEEIAEHLLSISEQQDGMGDILERLTFKPAGYPQDSDALMLRIPTED